MDKKRVKKNASIGAAIAPWLMVPFEFVKKPYRGEAEAILAIAVVVGFIGVVIWSRTRA